jgi:hypothetical protein
MFWNPNHADTSVKDITPTSLHNRPHAERNETCGTHSSREVLCAKVEAPSSASLGGRYLSRPKGSSGLKNRIHWSSLQISRPHNDFFITS